MGEPMGRLGRSSAQRGRLAWSAAIAGAVAIVALVMLVADVADGNEVAATLLLAPVCIAALWLGRTAGLVAAAVAAVVYAVLRLGDVDDAGATGVAVLIAARAAAFGAVAWWTPAVAHRLPGLTHIPRHRVHQQLGSSVDGQLSAVSALSELGGAHRGPPPVHAARVAEPAPLVRPEEESYAIGWETEVAEEEPWDAASVPVSPTWEEPLSPPVESWTGEPELFQPPAAELEVGEELDEMGEPGPLEPVAWDHPTDPAISTGNGGWDDPQEAPAREQSWDDEVAAAPIPVAPGGWDEPSIAASVDLPTGWIDDATNPLGDESIPVGYTGELFLPPDLAAHPASVASEPLGNGSTTMTPPHEPQPISAPSGYDQGVPAPPTGPPPPDSPPFPGAIGPTVGVEPVAHVSTQDPETRLWNARFFRDRLSAEVDYARQTQTPFSVVLVQVPDEPFRALPYRRQVALLRELGHQFVSARVVDHLVHLPDGDRHWFAVVLSDTDRDTAHGFEKRLRSAIGGYLRHRGLQVQGVQSASMTSPDDDEVMADVWASLLGPAAHSGGSGR